MCNRYLVVVESQGRPEAESLPREICRTWSLDVSGITTCPSSPQVLSGPQNERRTNWLQSYLPPVRTHHTGSSMVEIDQALTSAVGAVGRLELQARLLNLTLISQTLSFSLANHDHLPEESKGFMEKIYQKDCRCTHRVTYPDADGNHGREPSSARGNTHVTSVRTPYPHHGIRPHSAQEQDSLLLSFVSCSPSPISFHFSW